MQVSSQHTAPRVETSRQAKALIESVAPATCLRRILYGNENLASPARKLAGNLKLVNVER